MSNVLNGWCPHGVPGAIGCDECKATAEDSVKLKENTMYETLQSIVNQLEFCGYKTKDGLHDLSSNAAFVALKERAADESKRRITVRMVGELSFKVTDPSMPMMATLSGGQTFDLLGCEVHGATLSVVTAKEVRYQSDPCPDVCPDMCPEGDDVQTVYYCKDCVKPKHECCCSNEGPSVQPGNLMAEIFKNHPM